MSFLDKAIRYCFYALFLITPLIFTSVNYELFEFNKMIFVYAITVLTTGAFLIKMLQEKRLLVKRTPLDIPILLFLVSQILATIFSIDPHTSVWGYYSRSNGGLLSIISYTLLYYIFVSSFTPEQVLKYLKVLLIGGVIVSLYAIPEHFGASPSCIIFNSQRALGDQTSLDTVVGAIFQGDPSIVNATCWVQHVQERVFATLGQPNWLAAYLGMLIFPTMALFLSAKNFFLRVTYYLSLVTLYAAFTFTYSRGATLGVLAGLGVFILSTVIGSPLSVIRSKFISSRLASLKTDKQKTGKPNSENRQPKTEYWKYLAAVLISFVAINLLFGSALTRFQILNKAQSGSPESAAPGVTQLESGGTESGQIRLIVWKGALEVFKNYPIFGSGVETFAYSYYKYRPVEHNSVSEWDFLYNKAHNEYLNYLATTGLVGFLSYVFMIGAFLVYSMKYIVYREKAPSQYTKYHILYTGLVAGYTSYLIQNIFGFSVVMIALLFYLYPAFVVTLTENAKEFDLSKSDNFFVNLFRKLVYNRLVHMGIIFIVGGLVLAFLYTLRLYWHADTLYKSGSDYSDAGNPGRAYNDLVRAVDLNFREPIYKAELGYAAGSAAVALYQEDATLSGQLRERSVEETEKALQISPANLSLWRTAIRTYYQLSTLDPEFEKKTLEVMDHAISLAPTDAKLYYNKALVLGQAEKFDEAISTMQEALKLKPNYMEAYFYLGYFYEQKKDKENAIKNYEEVLKFDPKHEETLKKLEELRK